MLCFTWLLEGENDMELAARMGIFVISAALSPDFAMMCLDDAAYNRQTKARTTAFKLRPA